MKLYALRGGLSVLSEIYDKASVSNAKIEEAKEKIESRKNGNIAAPEMLQFAKNELYEKLEIAKELVEQKKSKIKKLSHRF